MKYNIGKAKYTVSFFNGNNFHKDGSKFWDITTFKNLRALADFTNNLEEQGYKQI